MIAGILLAAGGARRFGSQKLVELLDGRPLVQHAASSLAAAVDETLVVIGSDDGLVREALRDVPVRFVMSNLWMRGLSESLRTGIAALPADAKAAVIMLGDQPGVTAASVRAVIDAWHVSSAPIVSTRYHGMRGHPVLFGRSVFDELIAVTGDVGGRSVIERHEERVAYVDIGGPIPLDVDLPADLAQLDSMRTQ